jgi:RHS repeat-associated protein
VRTVVLSTSRYTGKERDAESGLDYFGARYYGSSMGRFMSPDWSKTPEGVPYADLTNPQSLNLYSYVKNNPLSKVDPDGHCCDFLDKAIGLVVTTGNYLNPATRIATGVIVFQTTMQVNDANNALYTASQNTLLDAAKNPMNYTPAQIAEAGKEMQDASNQIQQTAVPLVQAMKAVVGGIESLVPYSSANATSAEKAITKGASMGVSGVGDVIKAMPTTPSPGPNASGASGAAPQTPVPHPTPPPPPPCPTGQTCK